MVAPLLPVAVLLALSCFAGASSWRLSRVVTYATRFGPVWRLRPIAGPASPLAAGAVKVRAMFEGKLVRCREFSRVIVDD